MLGIVFFVFIAAGLALLVINIMKEMKQEAPEQASGIPIGLRIPSWPGLSSSDKAPTLTALKLPVSALSVSVEDVNSATKVVSAIAAQPKDGAMQTLEQKYATLEKILAEKNQDLSRLEESLKAEQANRQEFETFRAILHEQIEDLKSQNKKLKDDLTRSLQENVQLQEGHLSLAAEQSHVPQALTIVHAAPDISGLSLKDIFDDKKTS